MNRSYRKFWTGARSVGKAGYVQVSLKHHPLFPGKTTEYEHRVVMAEKLGRRLHQYELVHHKDENKQNNSLRNLALTTKTKHKKHFHRKPCSPETRAKISAIKKGMKVPWMVGHTFNRGRKRSEVFKKKVSESMLRYRKLNPFSKETRRKLSIKALRREAAKRRVAAFGNRNHK